MGSTPRENAVESVIAEGRNCIVTRVASALNDLEKVVTQAHVSRLALANAIGAARASMKSATADVESTPCGAQCCRCLGALATASTDLIAH